ncbi:hypothetical protein [Alicyclobacillus dauci]|uniref:Uncharacterized protein n=1 Tax=Alicyclobacillus dauci TaxID=1475485 RepID=A0ABY6Z9Q7_9BACL|nr:hypothetical protein [Alicyclobacillus dauci]WAH39572.1 hypothetical protein NZD86_24105 [Alicyclobacillus dauci]
MRLRQVSIYNERTGETVPWDAAPEEWRQNIKEHGSNIFRKIVFSNLKKCRMRLVAEYEEIDEIISRDVIDGIPLTFATVKPCRKHHESTVKIDIDENGKQYYVVTFLPGFLSEQKTSYTARNDDED